MIGAASRAATAAVAGALLVGLTAAPAAAAGATLSPSYGPVGAVVTITDSSGGLTGAKDVTFNGVDAGVPTPVDDQHVRAKVPAGAKTGSVVVTAADNSTIAAGTFTVQRPTSATISRSARIVTFPQRLTIRSVLTSGGAAVSGQPARLQRSVIGSGQWHGYGVVRTTSSHGAVAWSFVPHRSLAYRVVFRPTTTHLGTTSPQTRNLVRPAVGFQATSVALVGDSVRLTGTVRPAELWGPVYLDRRVGTTWHRVARANRISTGHWAVWTSLPATGSNVYRLRRPADATHLGAVSPSRGIYGVSRSLSQGTSGSDVTALQKRLLALHYDVGAVTGSFNYDTLHAVVAFEKVQGVTRDGVVGAKVWHKLAMPRVPHLLHPLATTAGVEVDLTHQVLLYGVKGHVRRILDASTGGGYTYTGSDGAQHQAITPTGHFSIVYKRDGWVTAPLGTLYRPAYFNNQGYAIHGEDQVPSYPASHGCVRITVPAMDRFNSRLTIGLSVWIYST